MSGLLLSVLLAYGGMFLEHFGSHGAMGKVMGGLADRVITLVVSPRDRIDVDIRDADPREALRQVLKQSGAMGVLKNDKLVVVATPDSQGAAGMLIEKNTSSRRGGVRVVQGSSRRGHHEIVRVFQGDITVNEGQNVQGDVVCVGGSIELKP